MIHDSMIPYFLHMENHGGLEWPWAWSTVGAQNGSPRTLTGLKAMWPVWTPVLFQLFPARMKDAPRKLVGIERTLCTEMFWQQFIDAVYQDRLILRAAKLQLFRFIAMYPQLFYTENGIDTTGGRHILHKYSLHTNIRKSKTDISPQNCQRHWSKSDSVAAHGVWTKTCICSAASSVIVALDFRH